MKTLSENQINQIENEILECIKAITKENFIEGYSWHISNYKDSQFKKRLSEQTFNFLNSNLSKHGKFNSYGGANGLPYKALNY